MVLFNIIGAQLLPQASPQPNTSHHPLAVQSAKLVCGCLNNGQCYSPSSDQQATTLKKKQTYCRCPNTFIGEHCEISALELNNEKQVSQRINSQEYKYFYYEPIEENMYSFTFDLCLNDYMNTKPNDQKEYAGDEITIFITTENEYGQFEVDEAKTQATTIQIASDECKQIIVDYTVLLITKFKTIQKFIFAVRFGNSDKQQRGGNSTKLMDKLKEEKEFEHIIKPAQKKQIKKRQPQALLKQQPSQSIKKRQPSQQQVMGNSIISKGNDTLSTTQATDTQSSSSSTTTTPSTPNSTTTPDYHPITFSIYSLKKKPTNEKIQQTTILTNKKDSKSINDFVSKSPSKIKQSDNLYPSRNITINFTAYPFMVEFVVFNILFSLTTLIAFVVVGVVIFFVRSRILGLTISTSLGINSRLINDLNHFDRYLPEEKFVKKEKKQGDKSPSSSELECAICLVKYEEMDAIRKLPCEHSFHKSCIDSWCCSNLTCPMCRRNLTQKSLMMYYNSTALELKNSPQSDQ